MNPHRDSGGGRHDLTTPVIATAVLGSLALLAQQFGVFWLAMVIAIVAFLAWASPRTAALTLLFMALVADVPSDRPAASLWKSPLFSLGTFLFENLRKSTEIEFLHISGFDLIVLAMVGAVALGRGRVRSESRVATPDCLRSALIFSLVAMLYLEIAGLLTGGDFQQSLWQARPLAYVPLLAFVFLAAFGERGDPLAMGKIVVAAALTKCAFGLYFFFFFCRPRGIFPVYITSHSDSALFGAAIVILVVRWIEQRSWRSLAGMAALVPIIGVTTALNNRRLAYVSLAAALIAIYFVTSQAALKRVVHRVAIISVPILALYVAVGWNSPHLVFAPIRSFRTMSAPKLDSSAGMRDIENYNLIKTIRKNLVFGSGFGHPYDEVIRGDDISKLFPQYRYVAHNDVLCLLMLGGLVGFTAVWLPLAVAMFLAVRSYRRSQVSSERAAALAAIGGIVIYMVQGYGDIGFHTWAGALILICAIATAGKVAIPAGAWPAPRLRQPHSPVRASSFRPAPARP
jgi:hypothetical protein